MVDAFLLEARGLSKRYGERVLFQDVSLSLSRGDSVSIQGRSGEGKSTLLHVLSGIEPQSSGGLYSRGISFDRLNLDIVRNREFGFVFQSFHLLEEETVLANVLLPVQIARWPILVLGQKFQKREWINRAEELLVRVGLHNYGARKSSTLSGGEKQRVAIARALIMFPSVLFLDEPTGNLDQATSDCIIDLLFSLFDEGAVSSLVIVTHDPAIARRASTPLVLAHGSLGSVQK